MKILFLTSNLDLTGGIQEYNRNLLKALDELNHEVRVVELKKSNLFNKVLFLLRSLWAALFGGSDVIFCTHVNFSPLCIFIKWFLGVKYVVFTHGIEVWSLESLFKEKGLLAADLVTTVSEYSKKRLKQSVPDLDNVYLLPNMINGKRFKMADKPKNLIEKHSLESKKVILTVARLSETEEEKGYDKVVKALPEIKKEVPNVKYLLVGGGGGRDRIKDLAHKLGVSDGLIMPGFVPDDELVDYYSLADVFVMPSKKEGFGIVFLEALACGIPVVAGNRDGSVDALQDGKVGILVNPDDVDTIADALIGVLQSKVNDKFLNSEYLRRKTLEKYGFDKFKKKVNNLIDEL